jgi:hypothetical protein
MQRQAYEQMVSRIDRAEYNEDDLIEISAPLNLPYYTDWQDFERRDGQVTINGVVYNYVARKYTNNVMVYKCIRNEKQQHINDVKKHIDDITFSIPLQSKQKKQAASLFSSLGEYDNAGCLYNCTAPASGPAPGVLRTALTSARFGVIPFLFTGLSWQTGQL